MPQYQHVIDKHGLESGLETGLKRATVCNGLSRLGFGVGI